MTLDKNTPVGTIAIEARNYPFRTAAIVSAEDFAEFGLEDNETYVAKRLIENRSKDGFISFVWKYINY